MCRGSLSLAGPKGAEVRSIGLGALHQADMLQPRRHPLDDLDHLLEHGEVGCHLFGGAGTLQVRGKEDVRDAGELAEFRFRIRAIGEVDRNVTGCSGRLRSTARERHRLEVRRPCHCIQDAATGDSKASCNEGLSHPPSSSVA
jgi:hypothetical protein